MVTTLKPTTKKTNFRYVEIGYTRVNTPAIITQYNQAELAEVLKEVAASPESSQPENFSKSGNPKGESSFFVKFTRPLVAIYNLVAGPAMTQRDRNRQAIRQANGINSAALNWLQRTTL